MSATESPGTHPPRKEGRSDFEQVVEGRKDAVERDEGGSYPIRSNARVTPEPAAW